VAVDLHSSRGWACQRAAAAIPGWLAPSPPTPLPRSGGEGRILCLCALMKARMAPLAPERGERTGVRGETPLEAAVLSHG